MTTARATSSWRIRSRSSASARTKPCSSASASPAARSPSRPPAPRRGSDDRPRRQPARQLGLDLGGRPGEAGAVHRPLRRRQQSQHAAAFGRPAGEAGRDEVGERPGERRALELAARRDQLLDDERRPRRALGHQDDDRGRRTLPVDPLDQPGDLATREGREVHPDGRPQARLDDREVLAQRMLPGEPVGLVGQDERDPLVARDAGHERRERAGRRVGGVQVLEHEDDRPLGGDPAQPAEQGLQGARLAALGVGEVAGARARPRARHARPCPAGPAGSGGRRGPAARRPPSSGRSASSGPSASSTAAHGGSTGPLACPRSTSGGSRARRRSGRAASSTKRVTPIPAPPPTITVVAGPVADAATASTTRASSGSRPMNRRLTTRPGMGGIVGSRSGVAACRRIARRAARDGVRRPRGAAGAPSRATPPGTLRPVNERRAPHPANDLNELPGEEWLYFTKSVWTTAYPSELGHARRRAHGANKPPRLMARLIEFFSRTGELVLDPFAGVGGTLLGAAIARGPRRALGIELDPRWVAVFAETVAALQRRARRRGPAARGPRHGRPGRPARLRPVGDRAARRATPGRLLPALAAASIDFVATDPPYNVQLPMTMAGGKLAETHANRRTDYAMRSRPPRRPRQPPRLPRLPRRDERGPVRGPPRPAARAATPC